MFEMSDASFGLLCREESLLHRLDEGQQRPSDHKLSLAAISPAELLTQIETQGPVTATAFHPSKRILALACDVDSTSNTSITSRYTTNSSSSSSKNLAILSLE